MQTLIAIDPLLCRFAKLAPESTPKRRWLGEFDELNRAQIGSPEPIWWRSSLSAICPSVSDQRTNPLFSAWSLRPAALQQRWDAVHRNPKVNQSAPSRHSRPAIPIGGRHHEAIQKNSRSLRITRPVWSLIPSQCSLRFAAGPRLGGRGISIRRANEAESLGGCSQQIATKSRSIMLGMQHQLAPARCAGRATELDIRQNTRVFCMLGFLHAGFFLATKENHTPSGRGFWQLPSNTFRSYG